MMSRTGIKGFTPLSVTRHSLERRAGFTLVEVMAAAAVLSLGAVLLYQAFFSSLDTFAYCADYLRVGPFVNEKVWEMQDEIIRKGDSASINTSGEFLVSSKAFPWTAAYDCIDAKYGLYRIELSVSWRKGQKDVRFSRIAYANYKK